MRQRGHNSQRPKSRGETFVTKYEHIVKICLDKMLLWEKIVLINFFLFFSQPIVTRSPELNPTD